MVMIRGISSAKEHMSSSSTGFTNLQFTTVLSIPWSDRIELAERASSTVFPTANMRISFPFFNIFPFPTDNGIILGFTGTEGTVPLGYLKATGPS